MRIFLLCFIFLIGCSENIPETSSPMEGEPVRLRAEAYDEMCEREPQSILCKVEEDESN